MILFWNHLTAPVIGVAIWEAFNFQAFLVIRGVWEGKIDWEAKKGPWCTCKSQWVDQETELDKLYHLYHDLEDRHAISPDVYDKASLKLMTKQN